GVSHSTALSFGAGAFGSAMRWNWLTTTRDPPRRCGAATGLKKRNASDGHGALFLSFRCTKRRQTQAKRRGEERSPTSPYAHGGVHIANSQYRLDNELPIYARGSKSRAVRRLRWCSEHCVHPAASRAPERRAAPGVP